MAQMTFDDIEAESRRLIGKTDATKGGLDSPGYKKLINKSIMDLCRDGKALRSVIYLNVKANDKYVQLLKEILWIEDLFYVGAGTGLPYPMDPVDQAVLPTLAGLPRVYWYTAVNVPDVNGPSTRSIGIHPYRPGDEAGALRASVFQLAKDLAAGGDVPEIHDLFHETIAFRAAWYASWPYKELAYLRPELKREYLIGVDEFKTFARVAAKVPPRTSDVMNYRSRIQNRMR